MRRFDASSALYKINDKIGIYLKYASKPTSAYEEYPFGFSARNIADLESIAATNEKTYIGLVCVKAREVCCVSFEDIQSLINRRIRANGAPEPQYTVLVTAKANAKMPRLRECSGKAQNDLRRAPEGLAQQFSVDDLRVVAR